MATVAIVVAGAVLMATSGSRSQAAAMTEDPSLRSEVASEVPEPSSNDNGEDLAGAVGELERVLLPVDLQEATEPLEELESDDSGNELTQDAVDGSAPQDDAPDEAAADSGEPVLPDGTVAVQNGVVHLTFDDGPHPTYTPVILDILARYDAKATFFVLGSLVEAYPELYQRILDEGHTVANHTWNHEDLATLNQTQFNQTVGQSQALLGAAATPCLRPPFGSLGPSTRGWAAELGLEIVLWSVDTLDWTKPGAGAIAESIVNGATSGAVILMHDGGGDRTQTIQGLDQALARLDGTGLRFEPICVPS